MEKKWVFKSLPDSREVDKLKKVLNISTIPATLLMQRDILTYPEAKAFFRPTIRRLHNPFMMLNMEKAIRRIVEAIRKEEKIMVYGDYDVDGTTSVAIVFKFLKEIHERLIYWIPNRSSEGYGISFHGIDYAARNDVSLIIALDCGTKARAEVEYAKQKGVDFIICDHHLPDPELVPDAHAFLNPRQQHCSYPFKELSGCGLGFKLMQALSMRLGTPLDRLTELLDYVVVSIAADIVPMVGENRTLAYLGLRKMNRKPLPCFEAFRFTRNRRNFRTPSWSISDIVFRVSPRLNAAGRMDSAYAALEFLLSENLQEARERAIVLENLNNRRKEAEQAITQEAFEIADSLPEERKSNVILLRNAYLGLLGIVASKLSTRLHKPTVVLLETNGKAVGSARSVRGFNIHNALLRSADLLDNFGGHAFAAGMAMNTDNIPTFAERFERYVREHIPVELEQPITEIDLEVKLSELNFKMAGVLKQMAPYGPDNMRPVFACRRVKLNGRIGTFMNSHLIFKVEQDGAIFQTVAYNALPYKEKIQEAEYFDIAFVLKEYYRHDNSKELQPEIRGLRFDENIGENTTSKTDESFSMSS